MSGNDLDRFMLACSDLKQPARSKIFPSRPGLKDIKVQVRAPAESSYQTSQKARDWSCLDLGDAFSQPQQKSSSCDDDEFDDFQSCPPPPVASGLATPLSSVPGLHADFLSLNAAHRSCPVQNGTGVRAATDLQWEISQPGHGNSRNNILESNVAQLNGLNISPAVPHPFPVPTPGSNDVYAPEVSGTTFSPLSSGHVSSSATAPGLGKASTSSQQAYASQTQQSSSAGDSFVSPAFPWASASPSVWAPVQECSVPPPTVGFTPVQPDATAKPTRFRQGLVQPKSESSEDDFADFVTAPVAVSSVASRPADWRSAPRLAGPPGRLPTLDDSPPPHAPTPASDPYAALRDLSGPSGPVTPSLTGTQLTTVEQSNNLPPTNGLHMPPLIATRIHNPPNRLGALSIGPSVFANVSPMPTPAPPLSESGFSANTIEDDEDEFGDFMSAPAAVAVSQVPVPASSVAGDQSTVVSVASSRRGSLLSLDLQMASAEAGEVSPLEVERRDQPAAAQNPLPAAAAAGKAGAGQAEVKVEIKPQTGDKYDVFREDVDKYDVFRQDVVKYDNFGGQTVSAACSESRLTSEWRRCLQACHQLLQEGVTLFSSVASSRVCSEVAASKQGANYINNLTRVHEVVARIEAASELHGSRRHLELILSETDKVWANLTAFIANTPTRASPELPRPPASAGCGADSGAGCGVCLLPLDSHSEQQTTLSCAGRRYHAACANLWTNRVSSVLPALRP